MPNSVRDWLIKGKGIRSGDSFKGGSPVSLITMLSLFMNSLKHMSMQYHEEKLVMSSSHYARAPLVMLIPFRMLATG